MTKDGGSAFPWADNGRGENSMTLRDYFAGQALASGCTPIESYAAADSMLEIRARENV